jgi:cytoskeletal protein CcmA (bactofilin family)
VARKRSPDLSIIDKDLQVRGTLTGTGKVVVKGVLNGALAAETVVIAEEGAVYAEADVANLSVSGTFEGDARISGELVVRATGKCRGKVCCRNIVVEAGGRLDAEISCTEAAPEEETPTGSDQAG